MVKIVCNFDEYADIVHDAVKAPKRRRHEAVTKNETLASLNQMEQFILAIAMVPPAESEDASQLHYVQRPFEREPGFGEVSVNFDLGA